VKTAWVCGSSLTAAGNMRVLRQAAGWSKNRLAREVGMSVTMVSFLEDGYRNFTLPVLERVAEVLGTSAVGLLTAPAGELEAS
jgi:transcriptional regulator with XRE-family HTH domain